LQDAELIAGLKARSPEAQEALRLAQEPRLRLTAWHILGHQDADAEGLVQEALGSAIHGLEGGLSLERWLEHRCVNLCFARILVRKRLLNTESQDLERLLLPAEQRHEKLAAWMEGVEPACREILSLRFNGGLGLARLKEQLKLPLGSVLSRLRRCQAALMMRARQP
jgi:DNA-directed RNA polymerase specialized sigma24 family protein